MRRALMLRLAAIAALVASAILTADHLNPGRGYCPLEGACQRAQESELGTIGGIPTSILGMAAFGGLFLLTLLPARRARAFLQPAGYLALFAGLVFIAYQIYWLRSFCPLCLVADGAGIVAGATAITWPRPPQYLWGPWLRGELALSRIAWTMVAGVAILVPLKMPRPVDRGWEEVPPVVDLDERWFPSVQFAAAEVAPFPPAVAMEESPTSVAETPRVVAGPVPGGTPDGEVLAVVAPAIEPERTPVVAETPKKARASVSRPRARRASAARSKRKPLVVVEYVNAYCPHCRATHRRLEKAVADMGLDVRWRRIYVWKTSAVPLWARVCAYAQSVGLEDRFWAELIETQGRSQTQIFAAARRAGMDIAELRRAVQGGPAPERLVRHRHIARAARLKKLPTIDIGRRRLMGAQSTSELRTALHAATVLAARTHTN